MEKMDLRKAHPNLFKAKAEPGLIDVPELTYLVVRGRGSPGGPEFQAAIGALYKVAYTIKFRCKADGKDFSVTALEGDYSWKEDDRTNMDWALMLMVPEFVKKAEVELSVQAVRAKKGDVPQLDKVELMRRTDGPSVHMLHVGGYGEMMDSVALLWQFMHTKGLQPNGPHHELYISDPNRVAPEKLKTIIRYPVREKSS